MRLADHAIYMYGMRANLVAHGTSAPIVVGLDTVYISSPLAVADGRRCTSKGTLNFERPLDISNTLLRTFHCLLISLGRPATD